MATPAGIDAESWKTQINLAKLLLLKYGALHSLIELQLQHYPIACCNISLDGQVEVDLEKRVLTFSLLTKKNYYKKGEKTTARHKYSMLGDLAVPSRLYEKEKDLAFLNLETWVRDLMWPDSKVRLYVDGRKFKESSFN
jgi:hypothetical protein